MDKKEYDPNYDVDFNRIKIAFKVILIIALFLITFSLFSGLVNASEVDLIYTPTRDVFYNSTNPIYDEQFNIRNQTEYTGIYNATYSFTDEPNGTSGTDINGIEGIGVGYTATIIESYQNHDDILQVKRTGGFGDFPFNTISQTSGTIEFYIGASGDSAGFRLLESGTVLLTVNFDAITPQIEMFHGDGIGGSTQVNTGTGALPHIKITFDCVTDTYSAWVNGEEVITDEKFFNDATATVINTVAYPNVGGGLIGYYDAIGHSWDDNYTIGDNVIPIINTLEINEVDKWEFALQTMDVLNPIGLDDPNGWTDYEQSGDLVNINSKTTNDRIVFMFSGTFDFGLGKTDFFEEDDYIYDISWTYLLNSATVGLVCLQSMKIYSNDSTLIVDINVYLDNSPVEQKLQYYDGSSYIDLETNPAWFSGFVYITYELYINYYDGVAVLRFHNTTEWSSSYLIPLIDDSKVGLGEIRFRQTDNGGVQNGPIKLDSIGVYASGKSISDEIAWKSVHLPSDLSIHDNNLFNISTSYTNGIYNVGNISLVEGSYEVGVSDFVELIDFKFYTFDFPRVFNFYSRYVSDVDDPYLIFYQVNYYDDPFVSWVETRGLYIDEIVIEGAKLVEGSNEYPLIYTYAVGHTEPLNNYFYVRDSLLRFTLRCQDSSLEYIQANFDISDVPAVNRSVNTEFLLEGFPFLYGEGAFSVKFSDATTLSFVFTGGIEKRSQILPQEKVLEEFSLLITDDDNDRASGNTMTGYLTAIILVYYPNLSITIATTNLLFMLIPLFVLILPPVALYKRFGYKIVIPMMMVMSIVCVASALIDYWMFFVLMFCFVSFILIQNNRESGGFL